MDFLNLSAILLNSVSFVSSKFQRFDWEKLLKDMIHKKTLKIIFLIINCEIELKLKNVVKPSNIIKYLSLQ